MKLYYIPLFAALARAAKPDHVAENNNFGISIDPYSAEGAYMNDARADRKANSFTPEDISPHTPDEKLPEKVRHKPKLVERQHFDWDFEPFIFRPPPEDDFFGGWKRGAHAAADPKDPPPTLLQYSESSPGYKIDPHSAEPQDVPGLLKPSDDSPGYDINPHVDGADDAPGLLKPSDYSPGYKISPPSAEPEDAEPGLLKPSDSSPRYEFTPRAADPEDGPGSIKASEHSAGRKLIPRGSPAKMPSHLLIPLPGTPGAKFDYEPHSNETVLTPGRWMKLTSDPLWNFSREVSGLRKRQPFRLPWEAKPSNPTPATQSEYRPPIQSGPPGLHEPPNGSWGYKLNRRSAEKEDSAGVLTPSDSSPGYRINPLAADSEETPGLLKPSDNSPGYKFDPLSDDPEDIPGLLKPSDESPGYQFDPLSHDSDDSPGLLKVSDDSPGYKFDPLSDDSELRSGDSELLKKAAVDALKAVDGKVSWFYPPLPKPSKLPPRHKYDERRLRKVLRPNIPEKENSTASSRHEPEGSGKVDVDTRGIQIDEPSAPSDPPVKTNPKGHIQVDKPFDSRGFVKIRRPRKPHEERFTGLSYGEPDQPGQWSTAVRRSIQDDETSARFHNSTSSGKSRLAKRSSGIGQPRRWKNKPWWKPDEFAEDWFTLDMEVCRNSVPLTAVEGCTVFRSLEWLLYSLIHTTSLITSTHQELAHSAPREQRGPVTISIRAIFFVTEMLREVKSQLETTKTLYVGDQLAIVPCYLDYAFQMMSFLQALGEKSELFQPENPMRCIIYDKLEVLYILYRDIADLVHGDDPAIRTLLNEVFPTNMPSTWHNKYDEAKPGDKIREYVHFLDWPLIGKDSLWRRVQDSWRCIDDSKQAKAHYFTKWGRWAQEGKPDRVGWFQRAKKLKLQQQAQVKADTEHMKEGWNEMHLGGI